MQSALSSEVNVLTHMLDEISSTNRRARDFTRKVLRDAIRETIACFPVYRTYIDERGHISDRDREFIAAAVASAKRSNSALAPPGIRLFARTSFCCARTEAARRSTATGSSSISR